MIPTSSTIAGAGCSLKFDADPSKYYQCSKAHKTCISAFENILVHVNSEVYDVENTAVGQTKHLQ